jgi:hypothetical protein
MVSQILQNLCSLGKCPSASFHDDVISMRSMKLISILEWEGVDVKEKVVIYNVIIIN